MKHGCAPKKKKIISQSRVLNFSLWFRTKSDLPFFRFQHSYLYKKIRIFQLQMIEIQDFPPRNCSTKRPLAPLFNENFRHDCCFRRVFFHDPAVGHVFSKMLCYNEYVGTPKWCHKWSFFLRGHGPRNASKGVAASIFPYKTDVEERITSAKIHACPF